MRTYSLSNRSTIRITLYCILGLIVILALYPWLLPHSDTGSFLLEMYHLPTPQGNIFDIRSYNFSLWTRLLGFISTLFLFSPLIIATLVTLQLCKKSATPAIFSVKTGNTCIKLGLFYLISTFLLQPIGQIGLTLATSLNNPGHRFAAISIDINQLTAILFSLLLILLGQVIKLGCTINEENRYTI